MFTNTFKLYKLDHKKHFK